LEQDQQILEEALRFFAEVGFEGQSRELAKRLSITHVAIYRHFPSKDALIERVYEHVYTKRWRTNWEALILDRSKSLEQRMVEFYLEYADCVFEYEWVRIFISSGMKSYGLPQRYLAIIRNKIIIPAALELRFERDQQEGPISEEEEEVFWGYMEAYFT
jgi:AcrR family transcriptional regulator